MITTGSDQVVTAEYSAMNTLTIEYPSEVLWALQQEPRKFEADAHVLLAVKLYETGRPSTGMAAQVAGVPRSTFIFLLSRYGLSPFGQSPTSWRKSSPIPATNEDKEDSAILQDWLQRRAAGAVETISLDEMEQELTADGLLPGSSPGASVI